MLGSYCTIFKVIGSLLLSQSMTVWGSVELRFCTIHDGSVTGGHTLHNFSIGKITDNSALSTNNVSQSNMQKLTQEITLDHTRDRCC